MSLECTWAIFNGSNEIRNQTIIQKYWQFRYSFLFRTIRFAFFCSNVLLCFMWAFVVGCMQSNVCLTNWMETPLFFSFASFIGSIICSNCFVDRCYHTFIKYDWLELCSYLFVKSMNWNMVLLSFLLLGIFKGSLGIYYASIRMHRYFHFERQQIQTNEAQNKFQHHLTLPMIGFEMRIFCNTIILNHRNANQNHLAQHERFENQRTFQVRYFT